ncbi:MAG: DUF4105 domain-containing protein [Rhodospirillaceae bacterium]|nr:MAG: DUF4105 domain-containing protein [Rhodospirillaceae bacterium]
MRFVWAAIALTWLVVLGLVGWAGCALYIDLPPGWQLACTILFAAVIAVSLVWGRTRRRRLSLCLLSFAAVLVWWLTLRPSNDRPWQSDVDRTAWVEINGNQVTIHNVRNFGYRTETDYTPNWEVRTYDMTQIKAADLFLTFWGSPWIAHPIISFQFGDNQHVAFSIETRKVIGDSYSAFRGFFRQYELIYIVADERDVIRLRTNYRSGEEVYLYRTAVSSEATRAIFLDYLRSLNALRDQPQFYNAVTSNCTSNIRIHTGAASGTLPPWDWRLLLNGESEEYAYQHGRLAGNLPFDQLKAQADINEAARAADESADFSALIRRNRSGFP